MIFTVFAKAQSSKVWSKLERELRFEAKPRAGALIWSQTSSGSSDLEQNLSRSSCLEPNLERERIRALSRAKYAMHGVVEGSGEQSKSMVFTVFLHV